MFRNDICNWKDWPPFQVSKQVRAFTLIELLVVISITALLISLLLPALSKARDSAMVVTCASNQRQCGIGVAAYAGDHQGWMPPGVWDPWRDAVMYINRSEGFGDFVASYLGIGTHQSSFGTYRVFDEPNNVMVCPTKVGQAKIRGWQNNGSHTYWYDAGVPYRLNGFASIDLHDQYPAGGNGDSYEYPPDAFIRLDKLVEPAIIGGTAYQKFIMADKADPNSEEWRQYNHDTGANYLHGDGHVESIAYDYSVLITGSPYGYFPTDYVFVIDWRGYMYGKTALSGGMNVTEHFR